MAASPTAIRPSPTAPPRLAACDGPAPDLSQLPPLLFSAYWNQIYKIYHLQPGEAGADTFLDRPEWYGKQVVSPDGNWIAYYYKHYTSLAALYLQRLDGQEEPFAITPPRDSLSFMIWSPDSQKLAYGLDGLIYIYDLSTGKRTEVTGGEKRGWFAKDWSPDSIALVTEAMPFAPYSFIGRVALVELDGQPELRWLELPLEDAFSPDWHPSEDRILLTGSNRKETKQVYVVTPVGEILSQLTNDPDTSKSSPLWSPSGNRIAYTGGIATPSGTPYKYFDQDNLYVMNADGSAKTLLHEGIGHEGRYLIEDHTWSPDGRYIAYSVRTSDASGKSAPGEDLYITDVCTGDTTLLLEQVPGLSSLEWMPQSE